MEIEGLLLFENNPYFFLAAFAILGGGVKYIDDAFDEMTFDKDKATLLAPVLGVLWGYTSLVNEVAATLLLAILLSVFFMGKIDNRAHQIGFVTVIALLLLVGMEVMLVPLALLTLAGITDEIGNDKMDKLRKSVRFNGKVKKFFMHFFRYRSMMKVAVLIFTVVNAVPLYFLLAFLLWDLAYHAVGIYSRKISPKSTNLPDFSFLEP